MHIFRFFPINAIYRQNLSYFRLISSDQMLAIGCFCIENCDIKLGQIFVSTKKIKTLDDELKFGTPFIKNNKG
mgnify:CR=1 FL=1